MDQKTWLWRKRSSEKTIVANGDEEKSIPMKKEVEVETSLKALTEKLASVVDECSEKDELVQKHRQMSDDAIADKNKAEEEVRRLKEELEEVLQQRTAANDRLSHLNSAFKDCMEQLNLVRDEQEQRVHDAVMKTSEEFEKSHKRLEEKLSEMGKHLATVTAENAYLSKALLMKEKLIEDLNSVKNQTEAEFKALMSRLDSTEKENVFLRYEFRTLEKELDLRNEEVEYCRRSVEVSNKQHLESVKKIKKLEADCQRLRALTRNRIDSRRKSLPSVVRDSGTVYSQKIESLIRQVQDLEKENKILKEFLVRKEEEILHYQKAKNSDRQIEKECKMIGASEMSLMDDFVEMEKLAIVAVDVPIGTSLSDVSHSFSDSDKMMTKELVPVGTGTSSEKPSDWLRNVTDVILEQCKILGRSVDDLLGDVRMALDDIVRPETTKLLPISGYITWKSPGSTPRSNSIQESSNEFLQPVRDEFRKHLGGDGPGTALELECVQNLMHEMEKMHSAMQVEIKGLKNELKLSDKDSDMADKQEIILSLKNEVEVLKESGRMTEDQIENLKVMNEDLDTELTVTKAKLNDVLQKSSCVEVKLDDKIHCYEELEGTCLELQLQLESMTKNQYSEEKGNQEELLQTGVEITKASAKLAECEETILKLGKQLKSLGSTRELSVVDKVLSITSATTKKFNQRSSLREQMLSEDNAQHLKFSREIVSMNDVNGPSSASRTSSRHLSFPDGQVLWTKKDSRTAKSGALVVVPSKKRGGGVGLLTKLLLRRKKGNSKNNSIW